MNLKISISVSVLMFIMMLPCKGQSDLNVTDKGMKQGHWIKKYPHGVVMYDGYFKDDHPVGEFRRYYENSTIKSVLTYSADGKEADAILYHPNGQIASKGKFRDQLKEGKWLFFSADSGNYLVSDEIYIKNLKNGPSVKYYPDGKVAEKVNYTKNIRNGEWVQYYQNGNTWMKSNYINGQLHGKFDAWSVEGKLKFTGNYNRDRRDGPWLIYNDNGVLRYKIEYKNGITSDTKFKIDQSDFIDSLERNSGNIPDPEKTGNLR
jgi:antitoxin component YwqK of YwqJK toxin-antitoxin module